MCCFGQLRHVCLPWIDDHVCVCVDHTYTFFVEEMPSPVPTNKGLMLCFGFWFLLVVDISG